MKTALKLFLKSSIFQYNVKIHEKKKINIKKEVKSQKLKFY